MQARPRYPALAMLQDPQTRTQPPLLNTSLGCFTASQDDHAPDCQTLTMEQYMAAPSCNCNSSITPHIKEDLHWVGGYYRYLAFTPPELLVSKNAGWHLALKFYFNCESYLEKNCRQLAYQKSRQCYAGKRDPQSRTQP